MSPPRQLRPFRAYFQRRKTKPVYSALRIRVSLGVVGAGFGPDGFSSFGAAGGPWEWKSQEFDMAQVDELQVRGNPKP